MIKQAFFLSICMILLCFNKSNAQSTDTLTTEDILNMSFDELMDLEMNTGNMTGVKTSLSPSAITTINREQIEVSHTRNLATLLETYVPGMMLLTHTAGDKIGIRGMIAAENYKLLLLVNGQNITNMTYEGVITEIDTWDLDDIEKIEVIRGAGSVTYGTGAIAGVINIITKQSSEDKPMITVGANHNAAYRSSSANLQLNKKTDNLGVYLFGSVAKTLGQNNPNYYEMNGDLVNDERYVGKSPTDVAGPQAYLADGAGRPQVKLHADIQYKENFKVWARYTQSGQGHTSTTNAVLPDGITERPKRYSQVRSFAIFPEYTIKLNDNLKIKNTIGFDAQEHLRIDYNRTAYETTHPNNYRDYAYSQNRLVARSLANYNYNDKLKLVAGLEYNHTSLTAPWFKSADHLLIREGGYIISNKETSVYFTDEDSQLQRNKVMEEVGDGISIDTYSFLFESSYKFSEISTAMLSTRLDKPSIAGYMFSPRLVLMSELNEKNTLRFSAQRSLRMMPLRAQFLYNKNIKQNDSKVENITSVELAYTRIQGENLLINTNIYYNDLNAVGYTGIDLQHLGNQKMFGLELEVKYNYNNLSFGANHSYVNSLSVHMNDDLKDGKNRNNISFSDYLLYINKPNAANEKVNVLTLEGYGNGLNNWSTNSSRLYATYKLLDKKLLLHANTRIFWDYQGSYDEMKMYEKAYKSTITPADEVLFNESKTHFENEKRLLDAQNAFQANFKLNASVSYKHTFSDKFSMLATLYAENLLGDTKRYDVSTGSSKIYPSRLRFTEEPRTLGFRLKFNIL